jgi:small subunit ribosomal protein S17
MVISSENKNKILQGEVVSDKMDKTITVKVTRMFAHPLYGKIIRRFKKYKAHDEAEVAKIGDLVEIMECRPLSKTKHMVLSRVIQSNSSRV